MLPTLSKTGLRSDAKPKTSDLRIPSSHREEENTVALGASEKSRRALHNPDQFQPQNVTGPLQKDFLDSFRAPESELRLHNASKLYKLYGGSKQLKWYLPYF